MFNFINSEIVEISLTEFVIYRRKRKKVKNSKKNISMFFLSEIISYYDYLKRFKKSAHNYNEGLQKEFNEKSFAILKTAYLFEKYLRKPKDFIVRELFRDIFSKFILKSEILKRFYEKPRGYPGDYFMFETIYSKKSMSHGLGRYFDHFVFNFSLAQSVVNRKDLMTKFLRDFEQNSKGVIKVSNIGCGPCREIRDLDEINFPFKRVIFHLFDQDIAGLSFARSRLRRCSSKINYYIHQEEIVNLIGMGKSNVLLPNNKQNVIYSLGVVDYFLNNVLERFILYCMHSLKKGGKLIFASCSNNNPEMYLLLTWFCEWNFYKRRASEIISLINNLGFKKIKTTWESNKNIFFLEVTK